MSSKVMITGGFGWLGSRLIYKLVAKKKEIVCVDFYDFNKSKLPKFLRDYSK